MSSVRELLKVADVALIHMDGRVGNAGLFEAEQFAAMRPSGVFLSLSRGFVVDQKALAAHIRRGHVTGVAVDGFPVEPKVQGDPSSPSSRACKMSASPRTWEGPPHEAQEDIGRFVADKLGDFVATGSSALSVNLPQTHLQAGACSHRLAHLHTNTPGVLAAVDSVLAAHNVNIERQSLATGDKLATS